MGRFRLPETLIYIDPEGDRHQLSRTYNGQYRFLKTLPREPAPDPRPHCRQCGDDCAVTVEELCETCYAALTTEPEPPRPCFRCGLPLEPRDGFQLCRHCEAYLQAHPEEGPQPDLPGDYRVETTPRPRCGWCLAEVPTQLDGICAPCREAIQEAREERRCLTCDQPVQHQDELDHGGRCFECEPTTQLLREEDLGEVLTPAQPAILGQPHCYRCANFTPLWDMLCETCTEEAQADLTDPVGYLCTQCGRHYDYTRLSDQHVCVDCQGTAQATVQATPAPLTGQLVTGIPDELAWIPQCPICGTTVLNQGDLCAACMNPFDDTDRDEECERCGEDLRADHRDYRGWCPNCVQADENEMEDELEDALADAEADDLLECARCGFELDPDAPYTGLCDDCRAGEQADQAAEREEVDPAELENDLDTLLNPPPANPRPLADLVTPPPVVPEPPIPEGLWTPERIEGLNRFGVFSTLNPCWEIPLGEGEWLVNLPLTNLTHHRVEAPVEAPTPELDAYARLEAQLAALPDRPGSFPLEG